MPRTEADNQRVRRDARARILAGARDAFARKGLDATMADVAASAGVSQGLPYRYFCDKDELVRALVTDAVQEANDMALLPSGPGGAAERLHDFVVSLVEARRARPEFFLLLHHVVDHQAVPRDLLEIIDARSLAVADTMRQLITEAQAAGDLPSDQPDHLVNAVMACLDGLGRFTHVRPQEMAANFPDPEIITRMLGWRRHTP